MRFGRDEVARYFGGGGGAILGDTPMHIWNILERAAALYPQAVAVVDGERSVTYTNAMSRARSLRAFLRRRGVARGDRVAVLDRNSLEFFEAYFAVAGLGAVLVPINWRLSAREVRAILADSGARIVLARDEFASLASDGPASVIAAGDGRETVVEPVDHLDHPVEPGDVAHLYYTSGTTGEPKGVMLTHRNVCTHALAAIAELGLGDADVWGHFAPMFHLADAWATFAMTWVGGRHVMAPSFAPDVVWSSMARHGVTVTNLVPTMLTSMLAVESVELPSLRLLMSGGAAIAPDVVRRIVSVFGCEYVQTYGMTETSPYLTLSVLKSHLRELAFERRLEFMAKTGRPFLAVELRVVDPSGVRVPADQVTVGEIQVRGETVTPGYWNQPAATDEAFVDGWLRTGDLAVVDAEGYVEIVDRAKDVIITGGENVHSIEVENLIYRHPDVLETAVYGEPDDRWGERVVAAVVLRAGAKLSSSELIEFCRVDLATFKVPRVVTFMASLPRTGSGKISKRALRGKA